MKQTSKIITAKGRVIEIRTETDDIEELRKYLASWKEAYSTHRSIRNYLGYLLAQAELDYALGDIELAADELLTGLDREKLEEKGDDSGITITPYVYASSLLVEILLKLGRSDDALEWANTAYNLSLDSESGMTNIAFAQELVACCLYSAGKKKDARQMHEIALCEARKQISELSELVEAIERNLDELNGE